MTTTITTKVDDGEQRRRAKIRRLPTWEPDPRWAHPFEAAGWCYVAGYLGALGVPPLVLPALGLAAGITGAARAGRTWGRHDYGAEMETQMRAISLLAGAGAAVWLWWAATTSPLRAAGWLLLAAAVLGGWYAVVRTSAPRRAAAVDAAQQAAVERARLSAWSDILERSDVPLEVAEIRDTRAGYVVAVAPPEGARRVMPFDALRGKLPDIMAQAAAVLARQGVTIRAGDIRVEETDAAHVHLIHVCTNRVETASVPFEPIPEPTTGVDPADVGRYLDGQLTEFRIGSDEGAQNMLVIGATGSGKSVLARTFTGRAGETVDFLVGVIAVSKLVPFVYPWLKPWLSGRTERPALDFVAGQDPRRALEALAMVWRYVCETNAALANTDTHRPTSTRPGMIVFVEECGKLARRKERIRTHDGRESTFSELLSMIASECRSAQVMLVLLNQSMLFDAFGDSGPEIARNTPQRVCLRTMSFSDGPATLPALANGGGADTTKLRHHTGLYQPSIDEQRLMPFKAYNLPADQVEAIAVRNAAWRPVLDPALAAALGPAWADRWDAGRLPELVRAAEADGLTWPGEPRDPVEEELREMIDAYRTADTPDPASDAATEPASTGGVAMPDAEQGVAELRDVVSRMGEQALPEPLGQVVRLLADPAAPRDFVSTRQLAIMLGRVEGDAAEEELREAARKLGRELAAVDETLRAEQRGRRQGYPVALLRDVARRLAGGGR